MKCQSGCQQKQAIMEQNGKMGDEMPMASCHATMHIFGLLVIVGFIMVIVLQFKMLKELRKSNKKR